MRLRYLAVLAIVISACSDTDPDTTGTTEPLDQKTQQTAESTTEPEKRGITAETVIHLSEERDDEAGDIVISEPLIFSTEADWSEWYDETIPDHLRELPADMREPTFDGKVAVAGHYGRCTEYSYLSHEDGEIFFHIAVAESEEQIDCAWAPNQVVVYEVSLDEIDASDREITAHPDYIHDR